MSTGTLNVFGLIASLTGSALLLYASLYKKEFDGYVFDGNQAYQVDDKIPNDKWQEEADKYLKQKKFLNIGGFGLMTLGTLLQIISALCV